VTHEFLRPSVEMRKSSALMKLTSKSIDRL